MSQDSASRLTPFPSAEEYTMICSPAGRIIYITPSLRALTGEDLIGRNLNDVLPDSLAAQLIASALGGKPQSFQNRLLDCAVKGEMQPHDGSMIFHFFPVSASGTPMISLNTAELISRELSGCLGTMFVARDSISRPESPREGYALDVLTQGLYRMLRLSRDLTDCALYENGKLTLFCQQGDLAAFCQKIASQMEDICLAIDIGFEASLPSLPLPCRFDGPKLERVLYHLFSNSIKYTRPGNNIRFSLSVKNESAVISVTDRGAGIPAAILPMLFTKHSDGSASSPLTTGGAGFGFVLARAVCTLHGGTCVVASTEGSGTTVTLTLPLAREEGASLPLGSPPPDYAGGIDHLLLELSTALPANFYQK